MSEKRFVQVGDTSIKDTLTGEKYYAPCEDGLLDLLNEQQATIRKLQDLCGKSDGENAKLRIENKMLEKEVKLLKPTNLEQYEQIQKLQEENEQLQAQIREKEQDEQLYANEIVKLNKEPKEVLDFKSLGGDY